MTHTSLPLWLPVLGGVAITVLAVALLLALIGLWHRAVEYRNLRQEIADDWTSPGTSVADTALLDLVAPHRTRGTR